MFLESERLYLRALEPEDLEVLYKWENDMELWRYGSSLRPYSRYALREYLLESVYDIVRSRQLRLMIIDRTSEMAVGTLDLYDYDPINLRAGVGILIDSAFQGMGYGRESLFMLHRYAVRFLHLHSLFAHVLEGNFASVRLFLSAGYEKTGLLRDWHRTGELFEDVAVFQIMLTGVGSA
jgi:diamine N-acetyltransferase